MGYVPKDRDRKLVQTLLVGLSEHIVEPMGTTHLTLTMGVVDYVTSYNTILEKPRLMALKATIFLYQLMIKFRSEREIAEVRRDQITNKECYMSFLREGRGQWGSHSRFS